MEKQITYKGNFGEAFKQLMEELGMSSYAFNKLMTGKGAGTDHQRFANLQNLTDKRAEKLLDKLGIKIETTYNLTITEETAQKIKEFEERDNYTSYK